MLRKLSQRLENPQPFQLGLPLDAQIELLAPRVAENGHETVVKLLLERGASPHAQCDEGENVLMHATLAGHKPPQESSSRHR